MLATAGPLLSLPATALVQDGALSWPKAQCTRTVTLDRAREVPFCGTSGTALLVPGALSACVSCGELGEVLCVPTNKAMQTRRGRTTAAPTLVRWRSESSTSCPRGLALGVHDESGDADPTYMGGATHLYVSDIGLHVIHRLRLPTMEWEHSTARGDVRLRFPTNLATHSNTVYVADTGNHRIVGVNGCTFSEVLSFGGFGNSEGKLSSPSHLAVVADELVVADTGNHRICWFSLDGRFLRCVGCAGTALGQFDAPVGIGVTSRGLLVVERARMQLIRADGTPRRVFTPAGPAGCVWGVAQGNNAIQLLQEDQNQLLLHQMPRLI